MLVIDLGLEFQCEITMEGVGPGCHVTVCSVVYLPHIGCGEILAEGETDENGVFLASLPGSTGPVVYVTIDPCQPYLNEAPPYYLVGIPPYGAISTTLDVPCDLLNLSGCVTSLLTGEAIENALVCVECEPFNLYDETDQNGEFDINLATCGMPGDIIVVTASAEGFEDVVIDYQTDPVEPDNVICPIELPCDSRCFTGIVIDKDSEEPIAGATVVLYDDAEPPVEIGNTVTDEDGYFELCIPETIPMHAALTIVFDAELYGERTFGFFAPGCEDIPMVVELDCDTIELCVKLECFEFPVAGIELEIITDKQDRFSLGYTDELGVLCADLPACLSGHVVDVIADNVPECCVEPVIPPLEEPECIGEECNDEYSGKGYYDPCYGPDCPQIPDGLDPVGGAGDCPVLVDLGQSICLECGTNYLNMTAEGCCDEDVQSEIKVQVLDGVTGEPVYKAHVIWYDLLTGKKVDYAKTDYHGKIYYEIDPEETKCPCQDDDHDDDYDDDSDDDEYRRPKCGSQWQGIEMGGLYLIKVIDHEFHDQTSIMYIPHGCSSLFRKFYMECCEAKISGVVKDENWHPIADAKVMAYDLNPEVYPEAKLLGQDVTDLGGDWSIRMVDIGQDEVWVVILAEGYAPSVSLHYMKCGYLCLGVFKLVCTDDIATIQFVRDSPVPLEPRFVGGVWYVATNKQPPFAVEPFFDPELLIQEGMSDYMGKADIELHNVQGERWVLDAHKDNYDEIHHSFTTCRCPIEDLQVLMPCSGTWISGYVTNNGVPMVDKAVEVSSDEGVLVATVRTDDMGYYVAYLPKDFQFSPYVTIKVILNCEQYCSKVVFPTCGPNVEDIEVDFLSVLIYGHVFDPVTGAPIKGALVEIINPYTHAVIGSELTGNNGHITPISVPTLAYVEYRISADGRTPVALSTLLPPCGSIVLHQGLYCDGAQLRILVKDVLDNPADMIPVDVYANGDLLREGYTEEDGYVTFEVDSIYNSGRTTVTVVVGSGGVFDVLTLHRDVELTCGLTEEEFIVQCECKGKELLIAVQNAADECLSAVIRTYYIDEECGNEVTIDIDYYKDGKKHDYGRCDGGKNDPRKLTGEYAMSYSEEMFAKFDKRYDGDWGCRYGCHYEKVNISALEPGTKVFVEVTPVSKDYYMGYNKNGRKDMYKKKFEYMPTTVCAFVPFCGCVKVVAELECRDAPVFCLEVLDCHAKGLLYKWGGEGIEGIAVQIFNEEWDSLEGITGSDGLACFDLEGFAEVGDRIVARYSDDDYYPQWPVCDITNCGLNIETVYPKCDVGVTLTVNVELADLMVVDWPVGDGNEVLVDLVCCDDLDKYCCNTAPVIDGVAVFENVDTYACLGKEMVIRVRLEKLDNTDYECYIHEMEEIDYSCRCNDEVPEFRTTQYFDFCYEMPCCGEAETTVVVPCYCTDKGSITIENQSGEMFTANATKLSNPNLTETIQEIGDIDSPFDEDIMLEEQCFARYTETVLSYEYEQGDIPVYTVYRTYPLECSMDNEIEEIVPTRDECLANLNTWTIEVYDETGTPQVNAIIEATLDPLAPIYPDIEALGVYTFLGTSLQHGTYDFTVAKEGYVTVVSDQYIPVAVNACYNIVRTITLVPACYFIDLDIIDIADFDKKYYGMVLDKVPLQDFTLWNGALGLLPMQNVVENRTGLDGDYQTRLMSGGNTSFALDAGVLDNGYDDIPAIFTVPGRNCTCADCQLCDCCICPEGEDCNCDDTDCTKRGGWGWGCDPLDKCPEQECDTKVCHGVPKSIGDNEFLMVVEMDVVEYDLNIDFVANFDYACCSETLSCLDDPEIIVPDDVDDENGYKLDFGWPNPPPPPSCECDHCDRSIFYCTPNFFCGEFEAKWEILPCDERCILAVFRWTSLSDETWEDVKDRWTFTVENMEPEDKAERIYTYQTGNGTFSANGWTTSFPAQIVYDLTQFANGTTLEPTIESQLPEPIPV
ncbi:hypothetical protein KIPB_005028 [Kipferlia bialata]|uniref:Carboxypeptidase regulatory-like domain-containing protein n=1 Tax=Kipferlia bialata TaxID=797122 RepID=A0A9K3CUR3_9EUKA|nr:hypothetical protein KIPB_002449 [Kipferlia bialata]GIQ82540.1 hypothetical protein KIPB_003699 [Kipferlia bialata]GIQ83673.1 hypothetical protein KIPB_005028 [Kipferlia bialata]|eukprot:g2449.t1